MHSYPSSRSPCSSEIESLNKQFKISTKLETDEKEKKEKSEAESSTEKGESSEKGKGKGTEKEKEEDEEEVLIDYIMFMTACDLSL